MAAIKLRSKELRREFISERLEWFAFDVATLTINLPRSDPFGMKTPAIPQPQWYKHQLLIRNTIEEVLLSLYPSPILDIIADLGSKEKAEVTMELSNRLAINYKRIVKLCGGWRPSEESFCEMIKVTSTTFFEEQGRK